MLAVVLYQPEIPPNTGNIIRLCANTGAELHLVEPLGFDITDKGLRRAGLDYHEYTRVVRHADWATCRLALSGRRMFAMTTKGTANLFTTKLQENDVFVFGRETSGLPPEVIAEFSVEQRLRLRASQAADGKGHSGQQGLEGQGFFHALGVPEKGKDGECLQLSLKLKRIYFC